MSQQQTVPAADLSENDLTLNTLFASEKDSPFNLLCQPQDVNDEIALAELIKSLNDLVMLRSKRISCIESRMSPYILIALLLMSLSILFPFFSIAPPLQGEVSNFGTMIFLLAAFFAFMFITLLDISKPFDGYWEVKTDTLTDIQKQLDEEIERSLSDDEKAVKVAV